jgi:hypothetical protein
MRAEPGRSPRGLIESQIDEFGQGFVTLTKIVGARAYVGLFDRQHHVAERTQAASWKGYVRG